MNRVCLGVFLFCAASVPGWAQQPDPEIVSYINSIKAIDNHAHVTALDREHDKGYDQLRCDGLYSSNGLPPANLRFGPDQQAAYKTLYGFEAKTGDEVELKKIAELETAARHEHGADFYAWVLEKAGIDTVFANRTAMAPEMKPPRLQWVAYEDALIFPLDNSRQKTVNPDRRIFYGYAEDLLNTYLQDAGMSRNPPTLDTYVEKVVRPTLQKQKNAGAMAVKFEAAYLRPLDFAPASKDEAARVYAKYAAGGLATPAEYKTLQDFLFEQIALEAGSRRRRSRRHVAVSHP
jgi:hypothetical protein